MKTKMFGLLFGVWMAGTIAALGADAIGVIISIQGDAAAINAAGQERKLELKGPVFVSDKIVTRAHARLQIMFNDDSIIAQGENGEMTIDAYVYNPKSKADNQTGLSMVKGVLRVITGKITDLNPERFKVKTRMATIGIRGCELGFRIDNSGEQVYIIRLPNDRTIVVERTGGLDLTQGASHQVLEIPKQGTVVSITPGRAMDQRPLTLSDLRQVVNESTPQPSTSGQGGQQGSGQQGQNGDGQQGSGGQGDGDGGWGTFGPGSQGGTGNNGPLGGNPGDSINPHDPQNSPSQNPNQNGNIDNILDNPQPTPRPEPTAQPDPTSRPPDPNPNPNPTPQPQPTQPPSPRVISGKALGGEYNTAQGYYSLSTLYIYNRVAASQDGGYVNGDASGSRYDGVGSLLGQSDRALSIPVTPYGSLTRYEGATEITLGSATDPTADLSLKPRVAYDNLGEFFRYINPQDPACVFSYGGYYSSVFGVTLPSDVVLRYDVRYLELKGNYLYGTGPALGAGTLRVNTRSGAYMLVPSDGSGPLRWGYADELEFFGREYQGVGKLDDKHTFGGMLPSTIMAGFKDKNFAATPDSGAWMRGGYSAGMLVRSLTSSTDPLSQVFRSANEASDDPLANEGRFVVGLDKDRLKNNVAVSGTLMLNPGATTPAEIMLSLPDRSYYVMDDMFAAEWSPSQDPTTKVLTYTLLSSKGEGEDWTWGEWERGILSPDASGNLSPQTAMNGVFVVGETLSPAAYQALANGPNAYSLSTPAGSPGTAAAFVSYGYSGEYLSGPCSLTVNVPGRGQVATWAGNFDLNRSVGNHRADSLKFGMSGVLSAHGHLTAHDVTAYSLNVDGTTYGSGSLKNGGATGSLVGPGTGTRPISGVIGQYQFEHNGSGAPKVTGVYGSDLQ